MSWILQRDGSAGLVTPTPQMPAVAHDMKPAFAVPSFDEVYQAHFAFVWRVLRTFGVPEPGLEDAAQDVFVVVHRRLADFEGRAAVTTWLFAIARRVAGAHRRRAGRDTRIEPLVDDELVANVDTFAALSRAQAVATVLAILDTMDEDKRMVFALVELEQLSVPEVAKLLDLNLNTTYSRLRIARQHFEARVRARIHVGGEP
ncbi:MAG: sigma-70 family RNA polymerase sigma factor [Kofleriaceae bacterium]